MESLIKRDPEWRWYHAALFLVSMQAATFGLEGVVAELSGASNKFEINSQRQVDLYYEYKQAKFIPPPWVFGPAWITNNLLTLAGNLRALNKHKGLRGRTAYLVMQGISWFIFATFNAASVPVRSPINAFVWTFTMWSLTLASIIVAARVMKDIAIAWSLATLMIWTTLASLVALFQMLWNRDDLYKAGPFAEPIKGLER